MSTIHTVDIIVTDGKWSILLVERGKEPFKGKLVLPGGHIDPTDESPAHAAARELREEAGIDVDPAKLEFLATFDANGRDPRGHYVSDVFVIGLTPEALAGAKAGSDATRVVIREFDSVRREEMGFDHYDAILFLKD
ncbi:NUDIX hydrolase [Candidatus Uhrbacteria bacterium]|nr:NUDIX hydrolase [Candidatus Uhrbacteria bacterium]